MVHLVLVNVKYQAYFYNYLGTSILFSVICGDMVDSLPNIYTKYGKLKVEASENFVVYAWNISP